MPVTIGNTTISGLAAGGLPSNSVLTANIADGAVATTKVASAALTGTMVQYQVLNSTTKATINPGTTQQEVNSNYRVSITPQYSNSLIIVHYHIPLSWGSGWFVNTVCRVAAKRYVGGTAQNPTCSGSTNGSRPGIAGYGFRPDNGHDANDMNNLSFTIFDLPNTTSTIQYGFWVSNEGGTMVFGYSDSDTSAWGWNSNIIITAEEIRQ